MFQASFWWQSKSHERQRNGKMPCTSQGANDASGDIGFAHFLSFTQEGRLPHHRRHVAAEIHMQICHKNNESPWKQKIISISGTFPIKSTAGGIHCCRIQNIILPGHWKPSAACSKGISIVRSTKMMHG